MNIWIRKQCCLYWPCYCGASIIWCYFGPSIIRSGRERSESWENATRLGSGGENWDNSSSSSPEAVPISWIKAQMSVLSPSYLGLPPSSCIIIVIPFDQMSVCWREGVGRITLVPIFSGNSQNLPTSRIRNSYCCCYFCFLSQKSEPSDWSRALYAGFSLVERFMWYELHLWVWGWDSEPKGREKDEVNQKSQSGLRRAPRLSVGQYFLAASRFLQHFANNQ